MDAVAGNLRSWLLAPTDRCFKGRGDSNVNHRNVIGEKAAAFTARDIRHAIRSHANCLLAACRRLLLRLIALARAAAVVDELIRVDGRRAAAGIPALLQSGTEIALFLVLVSLTFS